MPADSGTRRLYLAAFVVVAVVSFVAAIPFLSWVGDDPNRGVPPLLPAPSAAVQKTLLAEFAGYPKVPLNFAKALPRGTDARGLGTLLAGMKLTQKEGTSLLYRYTFASMPGEGEVFETAALLWVEGDPPRIVAARVEQRFPIN